MWHEHTGWRVQHSEIGLFQRHGGDAARTEKGPAARLRGLHRRGNRNLLHRDRRDPVAKQVPPQGEKRYHGGKEISQDVGGELHVRDEPHIAATPGD